MINAVDFIKWFNEKYKTTIIVNGIKCEFVKEHPDTQTMLCQYEATLSME